MLVTSGLKQGAKLKAANSNISSFSSKAVQNTVYRMFLKTKGTTLDDIDIESAGFVGRDCDQKVLGNSFIIYDDTDLEFEEGSMKYKDLTALPKLAAIATALHAASCERECKEAEKKLEEEAAIMGNPVNQVTLDNAIRKIKTKYFGDEETKAFAEISPVIRSRKPAQVVEVFAVPMKDGVPDFKSSFIGAMDLKDKKVNQLQTIMGNSDYCRPEDGYLEVEFNYMGDTKQKAGQDASFNGVAESISIMHADKYKDLWAANKSRLDALSKDSQTVYDRNPKVRFAISPKEAVAAFTKYLSTQVLTLVHLDFESDIVKKNAQAIYDMLPGQNGGVIKEKLSAIIAAQKAEGEAEGEDAESVVDEKVVQIAAAQSLGQVASLGSIDELVGTDDGVDGL